MDTLQVPGRFNGPASSGNGGWTSGALAEISALRQPVTVQLRRPPPLDRPLDVVRNAGSVELRDGEDLVAVATSGGELSWSPPEPVDLGTAAEAGTAYPGHRSHPFPRCFSCGPDRKDGLRIFPGRVDATRVAATWTPAHDAVDTPATWAALDCVSAWSSDLEQRPLVLAQMTARIESPPQAGTPYAVVGTTLLTEGRKTWTASALYDSDGELVAQAQHLWIAIDPAVVEQLQEG